jgi:hypothetical protein
MNNPMKDTVVVEGFQKSTIIIMNSHFEVSAIFHGTVDCNPIETGRKLHSGSSKIYQRIWLMALLHLGPIKHSTCH